MAESTAGNTNGNGTTTTTTPAAADAAAATTTAAADAATATGTAAADAAAATGTAAAEAAAAVGTAAAAAAAEAAAPAGPPAAYALTLPDGSPLDAADVASVEVFARSKGLTNEAAQAALAEYSALTSAQSARFLGELQAHPEVGGANLEVAQRQAQQALEKFLPASSPEGAALRGALNKTGYGNWAPLVMLLSHVGKAMGEDGVLSRDASRTGQPARDPATVLYGNT